MEEVSSLKEKIKKILMKYKCPYLYPVTNCAGCYSFDECNRETNQVLLIIDKLYNEKMNVKLAQALKGEMK